jgi:two-component system, NarL family, invasion response regulator UvrY
LVKILIVDDHDLVRFGIRKILQETEGFDIVGEAESGDEALQLTRNTNPDVILLDVKMPGSMDGIEATKRLLRVKPNVKIIIVTAHSEDPFPSRLLQAGAMGFLTKECGMEEMVKAVRRVAEGERYITPEVAQQLALRSLSDVPTDSAPLEILSERELQVMIMITSGAKVQEIADKLCLSTKTVNSYRYRLFDKFKVRNDVELTHLALRYGLIDKDILNSEKRD